MACWTKRNFAKQQKYKPNNNKKWKKDQKWIFKGVISWVSEWINSQNEECK